jgi:DNA replication and repair protein RecF
LHIERLVLTNFRSFASAEILFAERGNLIEGPNAQGKTNLLEAIHVLCVGRSHRDRREENLVRFGEAFYRIEGTFRHIGVKTVIEVGCSEERKRIRINAKEARPATLIGLAPVVISSPDDIDMIKRSPAYRRAFLDMALSQVSREYLANLQQYARALAHRNMLIRRWQEGDVSPAESQAWDEALLDRGEKIVRARLEFLCEMEPHVARNFGTIGDRPARIDLVYEPRGYSICRGRGTQGDGQAGDGLGVREGLAEALGSGRRLEIARGFTLFGPHVDDFKFIADGRDIRIFGSEGEQRTAVLALRCAEAAIMKVRMGYFPIVLLDDVFAELDEVRSRALTSLIAGFDQIILTSSRPAGLEDRGLEEIMVAEGRVTYGGR